MFYLNDKILGQGALYRYDAVGSYERVRAVCAGRGEKLIQPMLDEITEMEKVSFKRKWMKMIITVPVITKLKFIFFKACKTCF